MLYRDGDEDTISALSTPPGSGGIAVIRVSGPKAIEILRPLCRFLPEKPESHRVYYGIFKSSQAGESVDEVLLTYFANGRSFTGEETVEISCHGGQVVTAAILAETIAAGARPARRGEFTYRAFMNGRLDLVQAESVLGLIESRSRQSARISLRQLQGRLSEDFSKIEDELVWVLAHLEASIDFSTEDIEVVQSAELESKLGDLIDLAAKLIGSYRQGRLLKEGIEVALVGLPNAGKSSLLNAFTGESRAIVTPHAGTTRDTIESRVSIAGVPVTFVDTAGLRTSEDEVERLGIERSRVAMAKADFVFYVIDGSVPIKVDEALPFWSESKDRAYVLMNKVDLFKRVDWNDVISFGVHPERVFSVSALTRQGFDQVERLLGKVGADLDIESSNVVTQARHLELLQKIHSCLGNALRLIKDASSPEFVAFELRDAIRAIHELLGKVFDEQVIDRIFKEFCLGK